MKKTFVKAMSMALGAVMLFSGLAYAATVPADVPGSTYEEAVTALIDDGVITGSTDGLFHPLDNLTRAQACVMIVKAIDPPAAEVSGTPTQRAPGSGFPDMSGYGWADGYVSYAVSNGIVNGYPDGTFKPGNNVTNNELLTMTLRAVGFKDADIGGNWPDDYIAKAEAEGILAGMPEERPDLATKEIAALMVYNKFSELRAMGVPKDEGNGDTGTGNAGNTGNTENTSWGVENLTFATGKFNDIMTEYSGTPISKDVTVYTYGVKADYKKDMVLPTKEGDYRKDTIQKYKLADTPCFYIKTGDAITLMVLPMDAGFSGRIYCVINGMASTTNGKGDKVSNIYTLAAAQPVSWLTKDSSIALPDSSEYLLKGEIYELTAKDGTITKNPATAASGDANKYFIELTPGTWSEVSGLDSGVISLADGDKFATEARTVVYVLNSDGKSYKVGKLSDVKKGAEIRAFSISEDEELASYITVNRK